MVAPATPLYPPAASSSEYAQPTSEVVVRVRDLHKWYGKIHALDGVDMDIHRGEVLGFLGPNGAGKTTFTKCALGFIRPTKGTVELFGQDVRRHRLTTLGRVGLVPDQYDFYGTLNGLQHLDYYGRLHGLRGPDLRARMEEVVTLVGMDEFARRRVRGYSHGMKQRLCIAQALINRPDFVIFDEPTNGLDPRGAYETRQLIKALAKRGHTIFMSSHILSEVEDVCTRVAILSRGRILVQASVAELRQRFKGTTTRLAIRLGNPDARFVRLLLERGGATKAALEGDKITAEVGAYVQIPEVVALLAGAGAQIVGVQEETAGLEQLFLELTKGEGGV